MCQYTHKQKHILHALNVEPKIWFPCTNIELENTFSNNQLKFKTRYETIDELQMFLAFFLIVSQYFSLFFRYKSIEYSQLLQKNLTPRRFCRS